MRRIASLLAVGVVALGVAGPGVACTLAARLKPLEPKTVVAGADAAFVGTLVAIRPLHPLPRPVADPNIVPPPVLIGGPTIFTFRVQERVKGDLADYVEVQSAGSPASCGLSHRFGVSVGLVARESNGILQAAMGDEHRPDFVRLGRPSLRWQMV